MLTVHRPAPVMFWRRTFRGDADQARAVRDMLRLLLADFPLLDDVLLVADELVVNAVRHTFSGCGGGTFAVEVRHDAAGVTVSVADEGGPGEPAVQHAAGLDESGRGLATVAALAGRWGWSGDAHGRTVRAFFAVGQR